jgi:molecular chaperone DnaK
VESERVIGIDLGTTNSVVGIIDGPKPRVVLGGDSKPQMRSVVSLMDADGTAAEVVVGNVAYDNWPMAPKDTIVSIKRLMGRGIADKEVEKVRGKYLYDIVQPRDGTRDSVRVVMGGRQYSPPQISAMILRKLKEDCEFRLGGDPVSGAVITVPAYFSQAQKAATRQAAIEAGLTVMKILDEPTAAAIAYGMDAGKNEAKTILVYDLGGGTFDVSVLLWAGQTFAPLALQGDMWLGGDDFDQVLVDHALTFLREEKKVEPTSNMQYMVALKNAAQKTKEALSSSTNARLIVNGAGILSDRNGSPVNLNMSIRRNDYETMIAPLVKRTSTLVEKALKEAGYVPEQISSVLMAGNSSMIPAVQQTMEEMFGRNKIVRDVQPKECVALGAAIQAARMRGFFSCPFPDPNNRERTCDTWNEKDASKCKVCGGMFASIDGIKTIDDSDTVEPIDPVTTIAPFHYGVQSAGDRFDIYVEKGEVCPSQEIKTKVFSTQKANQRMLYIPVYAGENREKASSNKKEGEAFAILPPGLMQGSGILIRLWLDEEGFFKMDAQVKDGPDLKPWMMYGEADAQIVEKIIEGDLILEGKTAIASGEEIETAEEHKSAAFDAMQGGDLKEAGREAEAYLNTVKALGDGPFDRITALMNFVDFILHEFGWALPPAFAYKLTTLRGELEELDRAGASAAGKKEKTADDLEKEFNRLPELVNVVLGMRHAIRLEVTPKDPVVAMGLEEDLDRVVQTFKKREPAAQVQLAQFVKGLSEVIEKLTDTCRKCGYKKPPRICPNCKNDILLPEGGAIGTRAGSGQLRRESVRGTAG